MVKRVAEVSKDVAIVARKVEGYCSAGIKEGDKIVIRGPNVSLEETDVICSYAFSNVFPTVFALRLGVNLRDLDLEGRLWQCVDPGPPHTPGGRVLFEVVPLEKR